MSGIEFSENNPKPVIPASNSDLPLKVSLYVTFILGAAFFEVFLFKGASLISYGVLGSEGVMIASIVGSLILMRNSDVITIAERTPSSVNPNSAALTSSKIKDLDERITSKMQRLNIVLGENATQDQIDHYRKIYKIFSLINKNRIEEHDVEEFETLLKAPPNFINRRFGYININLLILMAQVGSHCRLVEVAIKLGADKTAKDQTLGNTPLIWAIANAHNSTANTIVQLSNKDELNIQDSKNKTALHLAVAKGYRERSKDGDLLFISNVKLVENLLKGGANPNIQGDDGNTPLHVAAARKDFEMVELLLRYGANKTIQNGKGLTPLGVLNLPAKEQADLIITQCGIAYLLTPCLDLAKLQGLLQ